MANDKPRGVITVQIARLVTAAAIAIMPAIAHAAVFDLNATIDGIPQDLGTVTIADQIVASGVLDLGRACPTANVCGSSGPWDQVSFNISNPALAAAIAGEGNGTRDSLELRFNAAGQVSYGNFSIDSDTFGCAGTAIGCGHSNATVFLQAFGSGGAIQTGEVVFGQGSRPLTLTWVPADVPEPPLGLPWLLAGLIGLPFLAGVRH